METLLVFIAMLLGIGVADLKSDNPNDYPEQFDQAKEMLYEAEQAKDGGNISDSAGA